ncbi:hypothetical protein TWF694_007046 [Orbilia ellipsospora]|uniref:Uncharacterized protein n=1 Tax=Orbilia ellipsospora TaxID=2528407 RepID=A0AAV9XNN4_9PEZI
MPWPWNRPKSPTGFLDDTPIPVLTSPTSNGSSASKSGGHTKPECNGVTHASLNSRSAFGRQCATTSRSTTPTSSTTRNSSSSTSYGRSASSLGFTPEVPSKIPAPRRHSRDTHTLSSNPTTTFRTPSIIPEEHNYNGENSASSSSGGTSNLRLARRASLRDTERRATRSPDLLSRPQPSVESLSSTASSLQSDINSHPGHGKRSLSAGSQLAMFQTSPGFANGRAFSPTRSVGSITHQTTTATTTSVTRSQKAIIPPGSRQSANSEEVYYELPESNEQVNGLNAHEIEDKDLKHKAVVDLNTAPGQSNGHIRTTSNTNSREAMLEAEVARLRKLCDKYKRASVNASSSSVGSVTDPHLVIPDASTAATSSSSEAHRVVKVMKVANEHLQKKIHARDAMLADRLAELETVHNRHAIELEQQKQGYQTQMQQLDGLHKRELEAITQQNLQEVAIARREIEQSIATTESQQEHLNKIAALQAEIDGLKNLEKTRADGRDAEMEEIKLQAAEEMAAAKKAWAEAEEGWEIKTEEMRRQLLEERKPIDCNCSSEFDSSAIDQLKRNHESEISALKTSIRILEGSRGTTVEQLEEDQRVYRKVSELEASLSSKVRALTAERKTSERLRASLTAVEEAKADLQLQKDEINNQLASQLESHERLLSEARAGSEEIRAQERQVVKKEMRKAIEQYESELEIERARVSQLREQYETDAREFDNRITELIKEHIQEKDRSEATHDAALKALEKRVKEQAQAEFSALKAELEEKERFMESKLRDRDDELASSRRGIDEALKERQVSFNKEKEQLIAEYQVVINAGDRLRDQDRAAFQSEKDQWDQLLAESRKELETLREQSDKLMEERLKAAQQEFETTVSQTRITHEQEKQTLQAALEEARAQVEAQRNALELQHQTQLREAEQEFQLRRNSEKQVDAAKFEEAKAEIERNRGEFYAEIKRLQQENTETKNRAAQIVSELQQQLKEDEESKQQLLDRVAKAEAEKDSVEVQLGAIKSRFDGANTALTEQTEALRKAEAQIKMLSEGTQAARNELENERKTSSQTITDLRSQIQSRETMAKELRGRHQKEIEDLQFQIRTAQTKLEINDVEVESLKETIRQKEGVLTALRDEKSGYGAAWSDEKRSLVTKHDQIIDGHLSTIAKLEDTINKMRVRSTEEARAAEAKAVEQQGLVAQWVSSSNRKADEAQRLDRALKEANTKTESFKLDVKALKNDLKQYEKESKEQKAEIKSLSKELKSAQEENTSLKTQMESSSSSSYRHTRQISDLETKIHALAKEIHDSRSEITVHRRTVAKRDSTIRQLEDALQQRTPRNGRASPGPNNSLQSNVETASTPTPANPSTLQRELRDAKAEITRLTEKLEMYDNEYRHFLEDHEMLKVEHEQGQKTMKAKLDAIVPELEQLRKSKRDLELRLQSAELRLATSGGLRRGAPNSDGPILRSQSSMSYLRHGEISLGGLDG